MLSKIKRGLTLLPGWRTGRKLVVLQSDDWFSIRTSSSEALEHLKALGAEYERCHYMKFDHFETAQDLTALFEVLSAISDHRGRQAILTANCLSTNPDFSRIEESGFNEYHAEPSTRTAASIPGAANNLELWQEAINSGICQPQSHGREHLHVRRWMRALQSGTDPITREAFRHRMFGVSGHIVPEKRESFLAALDTTKESDSHVPGAIVNDALTEFADIFGFPSHSFIAPNYVWGDEIEPVLHRSGVRFIQSGRVQWHPSSDRSQRLRQRRFLGQTNGLGQTYLVRNVDFEPSSNPSLDWQDHAMSQVRMAFTLRKPAVISTHRVNYMGALDTSNRDRGLRSLQGLLQGILKQWPEAEFFSTTELGELVQEHQGS